jgi:hypothetical protein
VTFWLRSGTTFSHFVTDYPGRRRLGRGLALGWATHPVACPKLSAGGDVMVR